MLSFFIKGSVRQFDQFFKNTWLFIRYHLLLKIFKKQQVVEVYLSLSDPASYLLLQVLPNFAQHTKVTFQLYLMYENLQVQHNAKLWRKWALKDANKFAKLYGLPEIKNAPNEQSLITGQQLWQLTDKTLENALDIFHHTWRNSFTINYAPSTPVITHQMANQQRQMKKGHYSAGSLFFNGTWYVGLERLHYLEEKLVKLGLCKSSNNFNQQTLKFTTINSQKPSAVPLSLYLTLANPYSYIGWQKAKKLSEHYQLSLSIKLLLPALMQGVHIPLNKQKYMQLDAKREAQSAKIPLNEYFHLSIQGVINSYELLPYAEKQGLTIPYIDALFEAIYVQGIDLSIKQNIEQLCVKLGINYQQAKAYTQVANWQEDTDKNQQTLHNLGFWGAPCFIYGETACWGQDRLWQIEQAIIAQAEQ